MREKTVLSLSYGRIVVKPPEELHGLVPESFETYQITNPGDIILRTTDLQNDHTSLRVGQVRDRGIITSAYLCLRVQDGISPDYGYQFLNVWDLSKAIYGFGSGLRQNLAFVHFKRMPVLVPPPADQDAIVRFLDHQDRLIRTYIRAKQKLIALLTEQKQAIIQRAVTRGLNPDVKLKPSGVDWLGEIPEDWEVSRCKHLFREVDRRSKTGTEVLLSLRMHRGLVPHCTVSDKPISRSQLVGYKIVKPGDLVMNRMRAAIGLFGVAPSQGLVSSDYAVFKPSANVLPDYYAHLFKTPGACGVFRLGSRGLGTGSSGFLRLYSESFGVVVVPLPPLREQESIVSAIKKETAALSDALSRAERQIALMREYRTRLIADVVTGKIDVREVSAALTSEVADTRVDEAQATESEDEEQEAEDA
jgi:type I restriction enzyme S subunit